MQRSLPILVTCLFALFTAAFAASAGDQACKTISGSLGTQKVATNSFLNIQYIASKVYWNTRLGRANPACVVYPASSSDVSTALKAIKAAKSRFAIKAGGHNPNENFSNTDGGVLLDLGNMKDKSYDPTAGTCTYQPGNRFGDL